MITYSELGRMGRFGNQLFEIATTISHARKVGTTAGFPRWENQHYFKYQIPIVNNFPVDTYREPDLFYHSIPIRDNLNLWGYFPSWKYFYEDIVGMFSPVDMITKYIDDNCKFLNEDKTCAVHVRRGDYLHPSTSQFHNTLHMDYYEKAMSHFDDDTLFIVCSEDTEWCMDNFSKTGKRIMIIPPKNGNIDFFIMVRCKNHIIANSSYSWWSSFLSTVPQKKIITPKIWYNKGYAEFALMPDLRPEGWLIEDNVI